MGLDMYAYSTKRRLKQSVDFRGSDNDTQVHYWRKHPNLHGWMHDLYIAKGGTKDFNCNPVLLEAEDLDQLELVIKAGELPDTTGFFFGESDGRETDDDLAFIAAARAELKAGRYVYYYSWW